MTTVVLKPYQNSNFMIWRIHGVGGVTFTAWNVANLGDGVAGSSNAPGFTNFAEIQAASLTSGQYKSYRTPCAFDTSGLPDNTTIFSATLALYIQMPSEFDHFQAQNISDARVWPIRIIEGTYPFDGPMSNLHFGSTVRSHLIGVGNTTDITTISTSIRKVTINLTDLSFINKTGPTKFMILSNYDYLLTSPPVNGSAELDTTFYNAQDLVTANSAPELTIQHQIVDVPTISSFI